MRLSPLVVAIAMILPAIALADPHHGGGPPRSEKDDQRDRDGRHGDRRDDRSLGRRDDHGDAPGHERGGPPGLARSGRLPPGLAKKFGRRAPERAYVAFDPRYDDRAWFLIDGRWVLQRNFDPGLRSEVHVARGYESVPPPVPLPRVGVSLNVVLFQ